MSNLVWFDHAKNGCYGVPLTQIARNKPAKMYKRLMLLEIWPQGCERPDASNMLLASPLASHSPALVKSPLRSTVLFLHNC